MESDRSSSVTDLSSLLVKLHHDAQSGVLSVSGGGREIKIYLKSKQVVHVEGLDLETKLLEEITRRKGLDPQQLSELKKLRENEPSALGRNLMILNLISQSAWEKFLFLKARSHLASAFRMEGTGLKFVQNDFHIPSHNSVNHDLIELVIDTFRGMEDPSFFRHFVPSSRIRFSRSSDCPLDEDRIPLSAHERETLSLIDGRNTVGDLSMGLGLGYEEVAAICSLLLSLGLMTPVSGEHEGKGRVDLKEMIHLYLDLMGILEGNFRREIGREFDAVLFQTKKELAGQSKVLFYDLDFSRMPREGSVEKIYERFSSLPSVAANPLVLSASFNKLLYSLLLRMKRILGLRITEKTLTEMTDLVTYVKKYRQDAEIMNYLRGNLEDYRRRIRS